MRIFVAFEDVRLLLDVQPGQTVGDVKTVLRDHFKLNSSHVENKILQLTYAGAILHDSWVCSDIGISSGATVKSALRESDKPLLHIDCLFNGEIVVIRDQIELSKTYIKDLRRLVANKTGLPVSVFRLCSDGKELFDHHTMEKYDLTQGSTIQLHVWDGWGDLLAAATQGHTRKVYRNASIDEQICRFQYRVACHIAAHFGYVDLANSLINPKLNGAVKPEEPVGQHPAKLWCKSSAHIDAWKCPVHEAAEFGNVNVLRIFVQNNICCLVAKDGQGYTPVQICCKYGQTDSLLYLTSKLYSSYTENNVTLATVIVIKCRKWCERARENVLVKQGAFASSLKRRPYNATSIIGHGVIVDGFRESSMQSRAKVSELLYLTPWATETSLNFPGLQRQKSNKHRRNRTISSSQPVKDSTNGTVGHVLKHSTTSSSIVKTDKLRSRLPTLQGSPERYRSLRYSSRGAGDTTPSDGNTDSASYIQTPKPGNHHDRKGLPSIKESNKAHPSRRTKLIEGVLSLPAVSVENTLRPFFHVSSRIQNPVQLTLNIFEKYREMTSRDNAIQCMIVASTFKDKAWLRQVDMAVSLAKRGVHNCLSRKGASRGESRLAKSLPTVAASALKMKA